MSDNDGDLPARRQQPPYRTLTRQQVDRAIEYARTGAMNDDVAALIGCHRASLYRWLAEGRAESERRYEGAEPDTALNLPCDLYDGIRSAHAGIVAVAAGSWVQAARTDWRAAEALLKSRFLHWRPSAIQGREAGPAEGAGNADDAADLSDSRLSEAQATAIAGAMRNFGDSLLECVIAEGVDEARHRMGALARAALGA